MWLNELKQGNFESDNEREVKTEGDEEMKSRQLVVQPEKPPPRPPPSPSRPLSEAKPEMNGYSIDKRLIASNKIISSPKSQGNVENDSTQPISNKKSTISHSILDMQSFSPPRVFLSHQTGAYHDTLNGDVFLSKFKHQLVTPNLNHERQEFSSDLLSESSPIGNDIHLQSPERTPKELSIKSNKTRTLSKSSLQIRVPSGRSPKRPQQSSMLGESKQIFDVIGYHLQPSEEKIEIFKGKKDLKRATTNVTAKSPKALPPRSNSAPRPQKSPYVSPYNSKVLSGTSSLPNKSSKGYSTKEKTRHVSPFPRSHPNVNQIPPAVTTNSRPRSAPPRNHIPHPRGQHGVISTTIQQSKSVISSDNPKNQKRKITREISSKSRKSSADEINLSLNSDYAVWK